MIDDEDLAMKTHSKTMGTMAVMNNSNTMMDDDNRSNTMNSMDNSSMIMMNDSNNNALLRYRVRFAVMDKQI